MTMMATFHQRVLPVGLVQLVGTVLCGQCWGVDSSHGLWYSVGLIPTGWHTLGMNTLSGEVYGPW